MKANIADAPWLECDCGGKIFIPRVMFKRISSLISPTGKEELIPIEVVICENCKKVPTFMNGKMTGFPEELKAVTKIIK